MPVDVKAHRAALLQPTKAVFPDTVYPGGWFHL